MILSAELLFSDGQSVTASGASTNLIDLGATGTPLGGNALDRELGFGTPIPIRVSADAAATGTSPTCTVKIQSDTTAAFSSATDVSPAYTLGTGAGAVAELTYIPEGTNERFIRLYYTLGGTSPVFTISAGIILGTDSNR